MIRLKVFISSVQKELQEERAALGSLLATDDFLASCAVPRLFDKYPAPLLPDKKGYLALLRTCHVYLLVIGETYGEAPAGGISATHEEYRLAQELGLPTLVCVKGDAKFERAEREKAFLDEVRGADHTYSRFTSLAELLDAARKRLSEYLNTSFDTGPTADQDAHARAMNRAAAPFERQSIRKSALGDLDSSLVRELAAAAEDRPVEKLNEADVREALFSRGYLWFDAKSDVYRPSAAAVLLLAKSPAAVFSQARLQMDAYAGAVADADALDSVLVDAPLPRAIEQAVAFIRRNTPRALRVEGLRRVEGDALPQEALREALANAVAHRDYSEAGAKIAVEVFSDRVVVSSPGLPPGKQSLERIARGEGRSRARNPLVVQGLAWLELMDERGSGVRRMREAMQRQGLALPHFAISGDELVVTLRMAPQVTAAGDSSVQEPSDLLRELAVSDRQREILTRVLADGFVTSASCVRALGIAKDTAWRDLSDLIEKELIVRTGAGKASRYTPGPALDRLNRLIASDPRTNIGRKAALSGSGSSSTALAKTEKKRDLDGLNRQPPAAMTAPDESDE